MTLSWMLYATVVSACLALAALALEGPVRERGGASRAVWGAALLASIVIPALAALRAAFPPLVATPAEPSWVVLLEPLALDVGSSTLAAETGPLLWVGWSILSLALILRTAVAWYRLRRAQAGWTSDLFEGTPLQLSPDLGPALVGLREPVIVVPAWLRAQPNRLRLALEHEDEHRRARDGLLLAAAGAFTFVVPWNPLLFWMRSRLRLAVEADCDRRVLAPQPAARRAYCELLLEVGRSRSSALAPFPALSEPISFLERRIDMITAPLARLSLARGVALGLLGTVALLAACFYPGPDGSTPLEPEVDVAPTATATDAAPVEDGPTFTPFTIAPDLENRTEVGRALEAAYPALLREAGVGGTSLIWFFIDATGKVQQTRVNRTSGHAALDDAALSVAGMMRFTPALNRDEPVRVWVSFPITFRTR